MRRGTRSLARLLLVSAAVAAGGALVPSVAGPAAADGAPTVNEGRAYPGDPDREAALVAAEDDRLFEVRTVSSLASANGRPLDVPYRLASGAAYTLVLTKRSTPYTINDLLQLAPQTFVRQPDRSYLLSENLVVELGATLNLADPGGLELKMASDPRGFVSIVSYGGRLNIAGTSGAPVVVTSWDRESGGVDDDTTDGRAYLRAIGGQIAVADTEIHDLGFWSGRTGGLSLTGTDRPTAGSLGAQASALDVGPLSDAPEVKGNRDSAFGEVLPAGELPVQTLDGTAPAYSYVSASISNTTVDGNAFGIFASGAKGLDIRNSSFSHSLVSGVVLHRYVVNAVIENAEANANYKDGFVLARATTGVVLSQIEARDNVRNGATMSGLPLADGPSATGTSVGDYGNNSIANSSLVHNGRYGVEVVGGTSVGVLANEVESNQMGIVVRDAASDIGVVGNRVGASAVQGIAIRDGVDSVDVSGNVVDGGTTSVYLRDARARVANNTLTNADHHALSVVGSVAGSSVEDNKIAGRGPSAIDTKRAADFNVRGWQNDTSGWQDTTPFLQTLKRFLQPLTLMWLLLGTLLLFTAVRGARTRRDKAHPYADKRPLFEQPAPAEQLADARAVESARP
jgi:hypothetical protein